MLKDAIASVPQTVNPHLDWSNLDAIVVVMAETDTTQFHRGQGTHDCTLPQGPGGSNKHVGCAIFSENPGTGTQATWGRFAHEIGHAFQENSTPAHPSNYQSSFELMDALYPGQTGVFEKQVGKAFTGLAAGRPLPERRPARERRGARPGPRPARRSAARSSTSRPRSTTRRRRRTSRPRGSTSRRTSTTSSASAARCSATS